MFSMFDAIKNIHLFYQLSNIECLLSMTFYKQFTFINSSLYDFHKMHIFMGNS